MVVYYECRFDVKFNFDIEVIVIFGLKEGFVNLV